MNEKFQNVRQISSPLSNNSTFSQSIVVNKMNFPQTKLDFGSSTNLISSQSSYSNGANQFYQSQVSKNNFYTSNASQSSVRQFYQGLGILPEQRLRQIAQNFIKVYGSGGQLKKHDIEKVQQIAHSQDTCRFEQSSDTVNELFKVIDNNRDKKVNEEDIYQLCRRYLNCDKKPIVYTPLVEERLSVARRLFKQFDIEKKGFLTEKQVPNLLSQTYRTLGRDFKATEDDIRSWMKLADMDGDGHVTLVEYQRSIIRALKKQGIKIYED